MQVRPCNFNPSLLISPAKTGTAMTATIGQRCLPLHRGHSKADLVSSTRVAAYEQMLALCLASTGQAIVRSHSRRPRICFPARSQPRRAQESLGQRFLNRSRLCSDA